MINIINELTAKINSEQTKKSNAYCEICELQTNILKGEIEGDRMDIKLILKELELIKEKIKTII